eukprot:86630_1
MPMSEQHPSNINGHSNYDICDLYIEKKYDTFKEEISNYKYISFKQYIDFVVTKANVYQSKNIVKQIETRTHSIGLRGIHYGIDKGSKLGFKNLISLILYTDFSDLCKDFSCTFRRTNEY